MTNWTLSKLNSELFTSFSTTKQMLNHGQLDGFQLDL